MEKPNWSSTALLHQISWQTWIDYLVGQAMRKVGKAGVADGGYERPASVQHLSFGGQKTSPFTKRLKQERDNYLTMGLTLLG